MISTVLLTGGSGRLGSAILTAAAKRFKLVNPARPPILFWAPTHKEFDILNRAQCTSWLERCRPKPTIVLHCAGMVDSLACERNPERAFDLNAYGAWNVLLAEERVHCTASFVYLSSDYVFDGKGTQYDESNTKNLHPVNVYGRSKLLGERLISESLPDFNTTVLRAPFRYGPPWPYPSCFTDQFTSCAFIDERARDIIDFLEAGVFPKVLHIGSPRKRLIEMAREVSKVKAIERKDVEIPLPKDVSLDSKKWQRIRREFSQ